jgi:hypothetical protein
MRTPLPLEDLKEDFSLDDASLALLEARLLRKETRHGGLYYEISYDWLAEAIRDERRWRLPRSVKIGLAMVVTVVMVAASLYTYKSFGAVDILRRLAHVCCGRCARWRYWVSEICQDHAAHGPGRAAGLPQQFSKHRYTQPQLLTTLCLMRYEVRRSVRPRSA